MEAPEPWVPDPGQAPVLAGEHTLTDATNDITDAILKRPIKPGWLLGTFIAFGFVNILFLAITYLLIRGVGIWGINIPVAWGFAIANFVWWIGIGHAGTFISAFLYLMHQQWRTSINRFAEAMTLFAVACAGMFPLLHLGRPWFFYWLLPYPDTMGLWPQFRSPLIWDVFAVGTYFTVSLVFWYIGLIPDLASMRDRASSLRLQRIYGILALGWRGSAKHWRRYQTAYLIPAALATPLVISVHSVVGLDFTVAMVPGWHSTFLSPYFVAGAIFSGFAMVLSLAIPIRKFYHMEDYITLRHLENCAKLMLVTGLIVDYSYAMEYFFSWYSSDKFESYIELNRALGSYGFAFWVLVFCNVCVVQLVWFKKIRTSPAALFIIAFLIQIGMWTERFVIVIQSLSRDFMPSAWHMYYPTIWDILTLFGTIGFFFFCFLLFVRTLPFISASELRELVHKKSEGEIK